MTLAFAVLARTVMTQAGATAGEATGWTAKHRWLWELTDAVARLTMRAATRHPSQFADWQAESCAMDLPPD